MAMQIGTFYNKGSHFEGVIETRNINDLGTVFIEPFEKKPDSSEPDFLVRSGRFQIGRGWRQTTKDGESEYINLIIGDMDIKEFRARLVKQVDKHILLWEQMVD